MVVSGLVDRAAHRSRTGSKRDLGRCSSRVTHGRDRDARVISLHPRARDSSSRTSALRRVPSAAWVCALVAFLNAVCWSILSPPFQVPDEPAHFAYVQQLAEAHQLPPWAARKSSRPKRKLRSRDLHHDEVQFTPGSQGRSPRAQRAAKARTPISDEPLTRTGSGGCRDRRR